MSSTVRDIRLKTERLVERAFNTSEKINLLIIPPGCGKTYATATYLDKHDFSSIFLSEFIKNNINLTSFVNAFEMPIIFGRNRLCIDNVGMQLLEKGVQGLNYYCNNFCDKRKECPYYAQFDDLFENREKFIGVHAHLKTDLPLSFIKEKDTKFLVIDENFINVLLITSSFTLNDTREVIKFLSLFDESDYRDIVIELKNLLFSYTNLMNFPTDITSFENLIDNITYLFRMFKIVYIEEFIKEYMNLYIYNYIHGLECPKNPILMDLFEFLKPFYKFIKSLNFDIIQLKKFFFIKNETNNIILNQTFYSNDIINKLLETNVKLIINDAYGNEEIYKKIFKNKYIEIFKDNFNYKVDLIKITNGKYSQYTLDKNYKTLKRVYELVKDYVLSKYPERVLIICKKKYIEHSRLPFSEIADNIDITYYYGLRGKNNFKRNKYSILIGTPYMPQNVYEMMNEILGITRDELIKMNTINEMKQAFHRIRPVIYPEREILIVSNVDLELKNTTGINIALSLDSARKVFNGEYLKYIPSTGITKRGFRDLYGLNNRNATDILNYLIYKHKVKKLKIGSKELYFKIEK